MRWIILTLVVDFPRKCCLHRLGLEWRDPNVTYLNLKKRNLVKLKEGRKIWIPELVFTNTAESDLSRVYSFIAFFGKKCGGVLIFSTTTTPC